LLRREPCPHEVIQNAVVIASSLPGTYLVAKSPDDAGSLPYPRACLDVSATHRTPAFFELLWCASQL